MFLSSPATSMFKVCSRNDSYKASKNLPLSLSRPPLGIKLWCSKPASCTGQSLTYMEEAYIDRVSMKLEKEADLRVGI